LAVLAGAALVASPASAGSLNSAFTVSSVQFGSVTVGTSASAQAVVTNSTSGALYFVSATVHGGNSNDFVADSTACAGTLAAGASCDISVTFSPANSGDRAASLGVAFGAKDTDNVIGQISTIQASLSGMGSAPSFTLSDASAGNVLVGQIGAATSTLTNTSDVDLSVHGYSLQGVTHDDFSVWTVTCPAELLPEQTCLFVSQFAPVASGHVSATLNVTMSVAGANPAKLLTTGATISGTGSLGGGNPSAASLSSLNLGTVTIGTSATGQAVLENTSNGDITVTNWAVSGNNHKQFVLGSSTCTGEIAPQATCTVNVTYTPGTSKKVTATLSATVSWTVLTLTKHQKVSATLAGKGLKPAVELSAPDFGTVTLGASTQDQVVVSNESISTVSFVKAVIVGPHVPSWTVSSTSCVGQLAPTASCEVNLTFAPHTVGDLSSVLNVVFNLTVGKHTVRVPGQVSLTATSVEPTFSVSAPSFSSTTKGTAVAATSTITYTSSVTLSLASANVGGTNPNDFSVTGNTCGTQLAAGDTCTLSMSFDPHQNTSGTRTANLRVQMSIDGLAPAQSVSLTTAISATES
jgi:hypothetical protein